MDQPQELEDFQEQMHQCVKCGACQAYCAVYGSELREATVARGKVALAQALLKSEVPLGGRFAEDMSQCLLCGSCVANCPNDVPTDQIVMAARRRIAQQEGVKHFSKLMGRLLTRPQMLNRLTTVSSRLQRLWARRIPQNSGLHLRFPMPYVPRDRTLPELPAKSLLQRYPERIAGSGEDEVIFFAGCSITYAYPQVGEAVIRILQYLGITVHLPHSQVCCGLPAHAAGDWDTVTELAQRNRQALGDSALPIITACASCRSGLHKQMPQVGSAYAAVAERVEDIHSYLVRQGLPQRLSQLPQPATGYKVTYHDPCHLKNEDIRQPPRQLLQALPGAELVEMPEADRC